jgi:hypothetical protein
MEVAIKAELGEGGLVVGVNTFYIHDLSTTM